MCPARFRALSCISLLSGTAPTAAGCSSYSMVTMTLDVRNTTVTVRCRAVAPEPLKASSRNASSPRSSRVRGWRLAGVADDEADSAPEPEGEAEAEAEELESALALELALGPELALGLEAEL